MTKKTVHTIEDIARLANVSKSTVSRALSNNPLIKPATRERIQAIAREHKYTINTPARNLSRQRSNTVAFVACSYTVGHTALEDLFGMEILGGISMGLNALGYDILVVHIDPRETAWAQQYLDSGRVDGFILMTAERKQSHIKALVEAGAPFIIWGSSAAASSYSTVTGDDLTGGRLAAEHFIRTGRQRFAFLGGPANDLEVQKRFLGYQNGLQAAGQSLEVRRVEHGDYTFASGMHVMQHLLEQSPDLDAVFVNSDLMAIGAINAIQNAGKRVPEDIAVVGYDDLSVAAYNSLPLTTIRQNIPLAGKLLAQNLVQEIQTGAVTHVTLPVELVVRKSA
jgi:DNA-binding LacI/PurR family transcriptional regulator